jgi:hypothetical protein
MANGSATLKSIGITAALLALLAGGLVCGPRPPGTTPAPLRGVWITDHDPYAGRYIDISAALFSIGQGGGRIQVGFIERVEMADEGTRARYTLHFRAPAENQDAPDVVVLYLQEEGGQVRLQLKNQPGIHWHREADRELAAWPSGSFGP